MKENQDKFGLLNKNAAGNYSRRHQVILRANQAARGMFREINPDRKYLS